MKGGVQKGHMEFCGVAIIERLEHVVQSDPDSAEAPQHRPRLGGHRPAATAINWTCAGSTIGGIPRSPRKNR